MTSKMRGLALTLFALMLTSLTVSGQTLTEVNSQTDTVTILSIPQSNTALEGADILSIMPPCVSVHQSASLRAVLVSQAERNESRMFNGFRVRVFHDNSQSARECSAEIEESFVRLYPSLMTARTYSNRYFNVTVGAFRTRSEAEKLLRQLQGEYPDASIVMEKFKYPMLGLYY